MSVEHEFEIEKARHKKAILKAKIQDYFETIQQGQINLPDFMRDDTPEKLADIEIRKLVVNDIDKFNSLYEKAYIELAPLLD